MFSNDTIGGSVPCLLSSILCQLDLTFDIHSFCEVESHSDTRLIQDNHMLLFKKLKTPSSVIAPDKLSIPAQHMSFRQKQVSL